MSDAELVRLLDGEVEDAERDMLAERLAADAAAAMRFEELRGRATAASAWLQDLDAGGVAAATVSRELRERIASGTARASRLRGRRGSVAGVQPLRHIIAMAPPLLRAAAIVLVFASAAMAIPPARAWILDSLERAAAALGLATATPATPAAPEGGEPGSDLVYHFTVASETFTVRVSGALAGSLVLGRASNEDGSVRLREAPGASVVVSADELHITSGGEPGAAFDVKLPLTVKFVRLRIAGRREEAQALPEDAAWTRTIDLTADLEQNR